MIRTRIRPHHVLLFSLMLLASGCGTAYRGIEKAATSFAYSGVWHTGRRGPLTETQKQWAEIAWTYFENNYNVETGFVNSIDRYPVVSMWHIADFIAALYCARELELIDKKTFDERFSQLLHQLNTIQLAFEKLPNALYNAKTGAMVSFANQPEETGWAIIDIGRLLFWLNVIKSDAPHFSEYIDRIVLRFSFCDAIGENGELFSARKENNTQSTFPELMLGYSDYAKIGFRLWGLSTPPRRSWRPDNSVLIYDVDFEYDSSWARRNGTYGAVLSTPFFLAGIETNWKLPSNFGADKENGSYFQNYAHTVYRVQERRYEVEGITTARTDHQLGKPPFYLQDSVFGEGYAWATLADTGENFPDLALVSTRATFIMWALFKTSYTDHLIDVVKELYDERRGWFEGRYELSADYERTITISTNALVLEALIYKAKGALFEIPTTNTYALNRLSDRFNHPNGCLPELGK